MAIWTWDEIGDEWHEMADSFDATAIWDDGWQLTVTTPTMRQFMSDRGHLGLEIEAIDQERAHHVALSVTGYYEMHGKD